MYRSAYYLTDSTQRLRVLPSERMYVVAGVGHGVGSDYELWVHRQPIL